MGDTKRKSGVASRIGPPLLAGALAAGAAMPVPASAAEIFLRLDGILGDSLDSKHRDQIDILSYTQSFTNTAKIASGTASGPGKVTCGAVTVFKNIDRSSPELIRLVVTGAHVPKGVLAFTDPTSKFDTEYYRITMTDVVVTGIEQTDNADPATIVEKVSILADRFLFEHSASKAKFGWDCVTKEKF